MNELYPASDDVWLNVVSPAAIAVPDDQNRQVRMKKTQIKREKYSPKIKSLKNKARNASQIAFNSRNIISKPIPQVSAPPLQGQKEQPKQQEREQLLQEVSPPRKRHPQNPFHSSGKMKKRIVRNENKSILPQQLVPVTSTVVGGIDVTPLQKFQMHKNLVSSLQRNCITKLTQIQEQCFGPINAKRDIIAKASTGSGKTLAYLIPLINQYLQENVLLNRQTGTILLVVCPSRQLCLQANNEALRCLKRCPFLVPGCLIGGQQITHEKSRLRKGVSLLFSTPGRLLYHLNNTESFRVENLKTIVFQEADRTLDMGFQDSITTLLEILSNRLDHYKVQKILVSAHFNQKVQHLISNLEMRDPLYVGFEQMEGDGQQINASINLKQLYVLMSQQERIPLLLAYLRLLADAKILIFVNTIDQVQYLDYLLSTLTYHDANGEQSAEKIVQQTVLKIHGNLDQKLRSQTYLRFKKECRVVLISTEVASRGLDFQGLNHIFLFDVPATITDYGNRVGRTARFNCSGVSLLMLHYQESDYASKIKYYCPTLEVLNKDVIFDGFAKTLARMNVRERPLHYLEGVVRSAVKNDDEKYNLARRAYTSMLRAYAKLKDKHVFAIKKLDLKALGRGFGINSSRGREYHPQVKEAKLEAVRKRRKVQTVQKLQVEEYL